ncbi:Nodule Cysteine-Rich (NCR) secreted peptide [Medicago truncatula]|uniref:Nodule Cysteine-Rich (NCR) secreted peptide n=2 Tax=Medicago truncatula TaxID=3880 RepID=A7KHC0_MEDTR|nr:nodule-specific cysteine-rich peptide 209 [Medicago truncatula]AES89163.1 Nodule Cysteine-Rich (NCR) secreted peptide [Medicago truncatula]
MNTILKFIFVVFLFLSIFLSAGNSKSYGPCTTLQDCETHNWFEVCSCIDFECKCWSLL